MGLTGHGVGAFRGKRRQTRAADDYRFPTAQRLPLFGVRQRHEKLLAALHNVHEFGRIFINAHGKRPGHYFHLQPADRGHGYSIEVAQAQCLVVVQRVFIVAGAVFGTQDGIVGG